jgi:S1-C subfamily serine protease
MGRELFNYGTLTINYIKSQYYFDPYPKRLNKEKSNFGFDIIPSQGKVMVSVVWENTLAQKSGLVSGSELVSINDITFQNMNSCEIDSMLLPEFSKKEIKVQFIKNGIVKKATLKAIEQTK